MTLVDQCVNRFHVSRRAVWFDGIDDSATSLAKPAIGPPVHPWSMPIESSRSQ
jgi:hypothetical protein